MGESFRCLGRYFDVNMSLEPQYMFELSSLVQDLMCDIRELKHATFLSHGRTPEVYCFPIYFTCLHTTTFTFLSLFALVEMITLKICPPSDKIHSVKNSSHLFLKRVME